MDNLPVIEIDPDDRFAELRLTAFMYYPADTAARGGWLLRNSLMLLKALDEEAQAQGVVDEDCRCALGAYLGSIVHDYGGWSTFAHVVLAKQRASAQEESNKRQKLGIIAGHMLRIALYEPGCGGMKDAARRIEEVTSKSKTKIYAGNLYSHVWPEFKAAGHLWAAFLKPEAFPLEFTRGPWLPLRQFQPGGLDGFLALAESVRQDGEQKMPHRGPRKGILSPGQSWTIRSQLAL